MHAKTHFKGLRDLLCEVQSLDCEPGFVADEALSEIGFQQFDLLCRDLDGNGPAAVLQHA